MHLLRLPYVQQYRISEYKDMMSPTGFGKPEAYDQGCGIIKQPFFLLTVPLKICGSI